MSAELTAVAKRCLAAAQGNEMSFPQIVGALIQAGFEGYLVDFRRGAATYYLPEGAAVDLPIHRVAAQMGSRFEADAIKAAIREAQMLVPGYTYAGFCEKTVAAGCAGYLVSFPGRRALYFGRTGETHVELFPD